MHNHNTRRVNDFHYGSSCLISNDPLVNAIHIWNEIPTHLKQMTNYFKFSKLIKQYFQNTLLDVEL